MMRTSQVVQIAHRQALLHHQVHHQIVSASLRRQQTAATIQLRLRLADRPIGRLAVGVLSAIGVATSHTTVMISAERHAHILARRHEASAADAEFAVTKLGEAIATLRYLRTGGRNAKVFELIGYSATAERFMLIALKFVEGVDDARPAWWVQTAHPVGQATIDKYGRKGRLRSLDGSAV